MEYEDFDLEIGLGVPPQYPVRVLRSLGGEPQGVMQFPFDRVALELHLKDLQIALLRSAVSQRVVPTEQERSVMEFGATLFEALFQGDLRAAYAVSLERAQSQSKGLRLRLRIQPPELAALPWEFLYDPRLAEFLCFSRYTSLVRYPELPLSIPPLKVQLPLRLLGMVASPRGLPDLNVREEKERLEQALADGIRAGWIELEWLAGQTWRDLMSAMRRGPWHIFHFIGHGGYDAARQEGFLALCQDNEQRERQDLRATQLARLLRDHPSLRLAVLNACEGARASSQDLFSSTASILLRMGLPAVVAMQYAITDTAAIEFGRAFYEALRDGYPVDAAVAEGRKAISIAFADTLEWGTPVLFLRAQEGVLFEIQEAPPKPTTSKPSRQAPPAPAPADVELKLAASPDPVGVQQPVVWQARVKNLSSQKLQGLALWSDERLISDNFALASGEEKRFEFTETYSQVGDAQVTLHLQGAGVDQSITSRVRVVQPAHLALRLQPEPSHPHTEQEVSWTLTIVNDGGEDLRQVFVQQEQKLLLPPFSLPVGGRKQVVFRRRYPQPGSAREQVTVSALDLAGKRQRWEKEAGLKVQVANRMRLTAPLEMEFVRVPAGAFRMGSDKEKDPLSYSDERRQHPVEVAEFWIGVYPVTNRQYQVFVRAQGVQPPSHWVGGQIPKGLEDHPVVNISWRDAIAFCQWLSQASGQKIRLPSEAEWEKAARGVDGRIYPWGDKWDPTKCNSAEKGPGKTTPVGQYSPQGDSPYGCADMAGNVWEWTSSLYKPYPYRADDGREDPKAEGSRVLRGGAWNSDRSLVRAAYRGYNVPASRYYLLGFRCVRSP